MEYTVKGFDCLPVRIFEEISAIPRASGNEAGVADYIERFAKNLGLFCYRDAANNVFITKPASAGREADAPLLLQAHTDMVAEKNKDKVHNFATDPIQLVQEGSVLRADRTTLGADDGYGVAIMLAALSEATDHPRLECLFTTSEETGMDGAKAFDYSRITARRMLNLDSAEEKDIIVGCCGGQRTDLFLPAVRESASGEGLAITVKGLFGGHSGEDIHRGRGNALKIMQRLLSRIGEVTEIRIAHIEGGDKDNAIPRECEAVVAVADKAAAERALAAAITEVKAATGAPEDAGLAVEVKSAAYDALLGVRETAAVLHLLATEDGVLYWRREGVLPQTSRNVASVRIFDDRVRVTVSTRSPSKEVLCESNHMLEARAADVGGYVQHRGAYPGWESPEDSAPVIAWCDAYRAVTGGELSITVIHAGLECGLICDACPGMVALAVGPNIYDLHTPDERMELDSLVRVWDTVLAFLAK